MNNIRIMQQTQWAIEYFTKLCNGVKLHKDLEKSLLEHVCFLTIFYYEKSLGINILKLNKYQISISYYSNSDNNESPEEKERNKKILELQKWGFVGKIYDKFIINYLQHGKCVQEDFKSILNQENKRLEESDIYKKHRELYKLYWSNFKIQDNDMLTRFS